MWQRLNTRRTGVKKRDLTVFGVWIGEARFQALLPAAGIILVVVSAEVSMMTSFALRRVHRTCNAT